MCKHKSFDYEKEVKTKIKIQLNSKRVSPLFNFLKGSSPWILNSFAPMFFTISIFRVANGV
jgi:hypothetical protein